MSNRSLKAVGWLLAIASIFLFTAVVVERYRETRRLIARVAVTTVGAAAVELADHCGVLVDWGSGVRSRSEERGRALAPRRDLTFTWAMTHAPGGMVLAVRASTTFDIPFFVFGKVQLEVSAGAMRIAPKPLGVMVVPASTLELPPPPEPEPELRPAPIELRAATARKAKVVLVLDYSGSMLRRMGTGNEWLSAGDPAASHQALVRAVDRFIERAPDLDLGLVTYASDVLDTVPIGHDNRDTILERVHRSSPCPASSACATATWLGLARAAKLFEASPGPANRYLILVSDGQPNNARTSVSAGMALSQAAAVELTRLGVTVMTIQIVNTPDMGANLRAFMKSLSGPPARRGGDGYFFDATDAQVLRRIFAGIGAQASYQLSSTVPLPPRFTAVLRNRDGASIALSPARMSELADGGWLYARPRRSNKLFVTRDVYARMTEEHDTVVIVPAP